MEDPARKRIKLDCCLICNNNPQFSKNREAYTKLLINYVLPPSQRDKASEKLFDFCVSCSDLLENLLELKEGLEFILNSIKSNVESIRFLMLKNGSSGNSSIDSFRGVAVKDYCPRVSMWKDNVLMVTETHEEKTEEECEDDDLHMHVESGPSPTLPLYTYEEYEDESELDENDTNGNANRSKIESYSFSKPCASIEDSSSNSSAGPLVTELQAPNLDDSIITVTEPPKFSAAHWQIYYENYKNMYKCKFCSTTIKGENLNASLARHINIIHAKNLRFKCATCFEIFFAKSKCHSHIEEWHYELFSKAPPTMKEEKVSDPVSKYIGVIPTSPHMRSSETIHEESSVSEKPSRGVARKKTNPPRGKGNFSIISSTAEVEEESTNSSGGYSDDKIRSEVVINIEPKNKYNLIEDTMKFEPWKAPEDNLRKMTKSPTTSTEEVDEDLRDDMGKEWARPMLSYTQLSILAIKNNGNKTDPSTVTDICNFICKHYPFFKTETHFRRKIINALESTGRKYFKTHLDKPVEKPPNGTGGYDFGKESRGFSVNDDVLIGQQKSYTDCFKESDYAMAFPERLADMMENLWNKKVDSEQEVVVKDSIDIVEGIGVKVDDDDKSETPLITLPRPRHERKYDFKDKKSKLRPTLSYSQLAFLALTNSKIELMKTESINDFVKETFPYFKYSCQNGNWRSAMSKTLSCSNYFKKFGPGPFYWKIEESNLPFLRNELKIALMKALLNFYFSLAKPDKLEELITNALGDEIDIGFVKSCIADFVNEKNVDGQTIGEYSADVELAEATRKDESDDDIVEIYSTDANSTAQSKIRINSSIMEPTSNDELRVENVINQFPERRFIPIRPASTLTPVSLVPRVPNKDSIIEIVEEGVDGGAYVYRLNYDNTFTFVSKK